MMLCTTLICVVCQTYFVWWPPISNRYCQLYIASNSKELTVPCDCCIWFSWCCTCCQLSFLSLRYNGRFIAKLLYKYFLFFFTGECDLLCQLAVCGFSRSFFLSCRNCGERLDELFPARGFFFFFFFLKWRAASKATWDTINASHPLFTTQRFVSNSGWLINNLLFVFASGWLLWWL